MTQCWSEGALRAYLDRELPTEDMQRVAAHLVECTACDNLCTELAARAAHVSALVELLPEWSGATVPRPAVVPAQRQFRPNWIGIAVALAAGLAVAAYLLPNGTPQQEARILPVPAPAPAVLTATPPIATAVTDAVPEPVDQPVARRPRRVRQAVPDRAVPEMAHFVALDDEPFESGVIMRVDVKPGNMQADIVFGPDGRAHAFRLVNASQRNF